jgi:cytoskeletal protein CcmA (bactofilin family)
MDDAAQVGPSIRIKGEVSASEPLTIAGHVDGSIEVEGHPVTILAGGEVSATVTAPTIVVGGSVKGRLNGGARIVVRDTATIHGDVCAPVVSLAEGATVQGRVETKERQKSALPLAS